MSMGEAIQSFFRNYANFSGRARRSEFWYWVLTAVLVGIVINIISRISYPLGLTINVLWGLATLVPFVALSCRRLHDTGKSGWFTLMWFPGFVLLLVPLIIVIVFWAQDSQGDNHYGPSPKGVPAPAEPGYPAL